MLEKKIVLKFFFSEMIPSAAASQEKPQKHHVKMS